MLPRVLATSARGVRVWAPRGNGLEAVGLELSDRAQVLPPAASVVTVGGGASGAARALAVLERAGLTPKLALLGEVERGAFQLEPFTAADVAQAKVLMRRFNDLEIGLADASIAVLSERHQIRDVLTLDERHFRVVPGAGGRPLRILPADARPA